MESSSLSDCSPSLTDLLKPSEGESDGDTAPSWQYGQRPLIDSTNRCTEPWGCTPKDGPNVTDTLTAAEALARVKRDCEVPDSAYEIIPVPGFFGMRLREAGQMSDFWNEDGTVARATLGMTHASVEEHNQALEELRSTADALGFDVLTVEYIRHAETAHNIAVFPELDGNGLEQYPLVYHDTELTTPENRSLLLGKPDLPDLPIDGLSQSQRLGAARYRLARQGLKLPQAMFISSLVRTGQTIQAVNDVCSSLASKDAPPSDRYDEDACPDHFLPFVLENNRELSHGSISDKRRTMTEFREKFPHAILGPGCTENDEFFLGLDTCQRMGIYDYEQRLAAGELEDPEVAKLYAPDSAEVTEGRRDILHKYGLHQLDGVKQQANARYLREDPRSVLRRSRLADEIMFDTMRSLRVHECLLGTHGLSSAVKLQDWWCNATLQKETRDAFGDKFASLFEAYGEDGKLPGTPAKMWRAEDRPMVLLVRRRDGKPVDPTMADAYKATVRSLVPQGERRKLEVGSLAFL